MLQYNNQTIKVLLTIWTISWTIPSLALAQQVRKPNVIIILTDDQGYGDLGITGNPHVKTPVIDAFARESARLNNFYVSPVCAPTRSSLLTGRYSLRTGIRDTYNGGATMAPDEVTMAEMLKQANYSTGIFGKWHLGDNYPSRPNDQGFDESVIHLSGGMGQVGDVTTWFKGDSSYFNPTLWHNGKQEAYQGYCSDIFAEQALKFIENNRQSPFFCYLAFNAPHTPLQVPDKYYQMYKDIDPSIGFDDGRPFMPMSEKDKEDARRVYAMVTNIDDNVGKLLKKLDEIKIADNTIVIFMTDNGPQQNRYVAGMRGRKGDVYRGGIRVPFYLRYPAKLKGNKDVATTAAHIDILPTIAEACGVAAPADRQIDGRSLWPLLEGEKVDWSERTLFFYWTRRYPELYNNMALQKGPYKLVGKTNYDSPLEAFELYNIEADPYEQNNIIARSKTIATPLKVELDRTYRELITSENLMNPPRIAVGGAKENPVILNRNDAAGERGIWAQEEIYGLWRVGIEEGRYNIRFKFTQPVAGGGTLYLETGPIIQQMEVAGSTTDMIEMKNVSLPQLDCDLTSFYAVNGRSIFPFYVELEKLE
ncbi:MAG: arylsulfatase [Imperialibacter sp.]|uniref:arylsulfatase n=1 Tax=Imperialibacter sp. TaxID=2038411 RepID=UPI0032EE37CD